MRRIDPLNVFDIVNCDLEMVMLPPPPVPPPSVHIKRFPRAPEKPRKPMDFVGCYR